jgi:hypothetical protein
MYLKCEEVVMENYFKRAAMKIYNDAKNEGRLVEGLTLEQYKENLDGLLEHLKTGQ